MATPIAIAVVEHAGRYLIGQRPSGVPLAGLWEFPGGKIEPGESPEAAAARECQEETGIAVEAVGRYPECLQEYDHGRVQLHFIACRPAARDALSPQPPFCWVTRQELLQREFPAGNAGLLQLLREERKATES
jgi:8-oxo-dGTP diphosphatase